MAHSSALCNGSEPAGRINNSFTSGLPVNRAQPEVGSCYDRDRPPTAFPQDCTVITISLDWAFEKIRLTVRHECFHSEAALQDASHFRCMAHFDVENRLER